MHDQTWVYYRNNPVPMGQSACLFLWVKNGGLVIMRPYDGDLKTGTKSGKLPTKSNLKETRINKAQCFCETSDPSNNLNIFHVTHTPKQNPGSIWLFRSRPVVVTCECSTWSLSFVSGHPGATAVCWKSAIWKLGARLQGSLCPYLRHPSFVGLERCNCIQMPCIGSAPKPPPPRPATQGYEPLVAGEPSCVTALLECLRDCP